VILQFKKKNHTSDHDIRQPIYPIKYTRKKYSNEKIMHHLAGTTIGEGTIIGSSITMG
jgi:hypothetical protein